MRTTRTGTHPPATAPGPRTLLSLAALLAAGLLLGGCAGRSAATADGTGTPPAGSAAVLDAYAQVQAEVDAAVRAGGPTAVEDALTASTAQVVKEADLASALGREVRLRITAAADTGGPAAASGCAVLWVRGGAAYWRGYHCVAPSPGPEVDLPEGQVPPDPSPPLANGPLEVAPEEFTMIMAALPPAVTALEAHAQVDAAMQLLSGSGPLPRVETQIRPAPDGSIDVAVAAFSYSDRHCILATRLSGVVEVWKPAKVQVQPGESSCDSWDAMSGLLKDPPH